MNADQEAAFWDWVAGDSVRIEANVYGDLDLAECLLTIEEGIDIDGWILDLGCGPGRLTRPFADAYPEAHLIGVDSSPLMITLASQLSPQIRWVLGNGRDLTDLAGNIFDAAYTMTCFQHIPPEAQQGYLAELHRVLKPEAKLRLQFVFEGETGPLSYPTPIKDMLGWTDKAGFREVDMTLGRVKPEWCWVTLLNL